MRRVLGTFIAALCFCWIIALGAMYELDMLCYNSFVAQGASALVVGFVGCWKGALYR